MTRAVPLLVLFSTLPWVLASPEPRVPSPAPYAGAPDERLRDADAAWDRGQYAAALRAYLELLASADGDAMLEPIALQTGELYTTTELTKDGAAPRFSPDGRLVAYETGTGLERVVRLLDAASLDRVSAELPGFSASFSPDSARVVYLKVVRTPPLAEEHAAIARAPASERAARLATFNQSLTSAARIAVRDLATGRDAELETGSLRKGPPALAAGGTVIFAASDGAAPAQIYAAVPGGQPRTITDGPGDKSIHEVNSSGTAALILIRTFGAAGRGGVSGGTPPSFGVLALPDGGWTVVEGSAPSFAPDGKSFAYVSRSGAESRLMVAPTTAAASPSTVRAGSERIDAPALSRDGARVAFQLMAREDWELYVVNRDGSGERRITREIQHDLLPRFLGDARLLGVVGEARHRRSYIYDLAPDAASEDGETPDVIRRRLFHNNTVRTIAPEYVWVASPDGTRLLIGAERDGDTVSPERGIYHVDLRRRISREQLRARLGANLEAEQALAARGAEMFSPIAETVRRVLGAASVPRVFEYGKALFAFDSKHISQPGNKRAGAYLFDTYASFGYQPEYQWFEGRGALGGRTANVIATLEGTVNPELVYVVSSHYDSVAAGPGADDDSSGTAALLEAARILAKNPQPATIVFASFTGEESGLLGSREFVRRAVAGNVRIVGALNNDMIGWANDHRLDNTIRYSNAGIRDVQHAAAMQFTNLITYDALYFKGTDAAAYYDAYGDIVGGIGSYPVLGNPHYHQPHDVLETINHQLVTEVAKTTAATLMLLASSPSRLTGLKIEHRRGGEAEVSWTPGPEATITGYIVASGPPDQPLLQQVTVTRPLVRVKALAGWTISVKAVNAKGLEGWDWARLTVP